MAGRKLKPSGTPYFALVNRRQNNDAVDCFVGHWVRDCKTPDIREHVFNNWVDAEIYLQKIGCPYAMFWGDLNNERRLAKRAMKIKEKTKGTLFEEDFWDLLQKQLELKDDIEYEDIFTKELYDNY